MPRSRAASLALPLLALLLFPILSCGRGNWPGAPEGYDYRTAHIVWKLEGSFRGTREEFIETSGYKDGALKYRRLAAIDGYDQDSILLGRPPRKVDTWIINDRNIQYTVIRGSRLSYKYRLKLDQYTRLMKNSMWREILTGVIPRQDLTQAQRDELRRRVGNIRDEDLKKVGAKITTDTFLGHKVKRYEIPTAGGRAILLLYGDIPLKEDLTYKRMNRPFRKLMVATTFELNKPLPDAPFTPPKNHKLLDSTKQIPGS